jgi:hypothetical protein
MNRKSIIQAAMVLSLALSSAWAGADTDIQSASLTGSPARAEGAVSVKRVLGDAQGPVTRLPAKTEESGQIIDCYYEHNEYHPVCQEAKNRQRRDDSSDAEVLN